MKKYLLFSGLYLLTTILCAQTQEMPDKKAEKPCFPKTTDVLGDFDLAVPMDSLNRYVNDKIATMQGQLQANDLTVSPNGDLIWVSDTVNITAPMHGLIDGVQTLGNELGLDTETLMPLHDSVDQLPTMIGSAWESLQNTDFSLPSSSFWATDEVPQKKENTLEKKEDK